MVQADTLTPMEDVAIIVPVLDDYEALARLAAQLEAQVRAPREIIVVSGRPDAELEQLCHARGFRYGQSHANRGAQLDHGARMATTDILWFLHADAEISPRAVEEMLLAFARGADGGCFRFAFQGRPTLAKRLVTAGVALRLKCGGMAYGDQGIFCRRSAYLDTPGFTHDPLFEEVKLVKALRRPPRRFIVISTPIHVAPRRWERDGWVRRSLHNRWLALCYICGVSPQTLDARYRRVASTAEETRI